MGFFRKLFRRKGSGGTGGGDTVEKKKNTYNNSNAAQFARARRDATSYRLASLVDVFWIDGEEDGTVTSSVTRESTKMRWSPHLKALLEGVQDGESPLSLLQGYEDCLLKKIYQHQVDSWEDAVRLTALKRGRPVWGAEVAFCPCASVRFPEPKDRSVNMLPFILGEKDSLPDDLQCYHDMVMNCPLQDSELGKVLYLTVEESWVEAGATQRRGGLHIESDRYTQFPEDPGHRKGRTEDLNENRSLPFIMTSRSGGWGPVGIADDFVGGLYMASNVQGTCRVYHALVDKAAVDSHGGLDFMSHLVPRYTHGYTMRANQVVWMTDRTPHEVLPQPKSGYQQFFRLVTSSLSIWNAVHNTANPKVALPPHVVVIDKSRFET